MAKHSYTHETYGERVANDYDAWYKDFDQDAITMLTELARNGRALELGIGTGRIALPLMEKNVEVHGLDASPSMVARMRAKPNGDRVPVNFGNFAEVAADGQFALIYVVFNTFFALSSQDEQVRCFRNVAAHLAPDGCFLIEAFVPDLTRFDRGADSFGHQRYNRQRRSGCVATRSGNAARSQSEGFSQRRQHPSLPN